MERRLSEICPDEAIHSIHPKKCIRRNNLIMSVISWRLCLKTCIQKFSGDSPCRLSPLNDFYWLLWNDSCQGENCLSKANIWARACEKSWDDQNSGIGHSVIRGLVTTGQWSARSSTVFSRGSRKCHHSQYVDSWTIFMCSAPHKCLTNALARGTWIESIPCSLSIMDWELGQGRSRETRCAASLTHVSKT